ncbi:DNA ligase [Thiomicrorhabdus sediminis]|uniref:DNA ligase n=1 Tax=Thiomicrorhabdus sediminis TaxID=2580412 RepID=A0A4V1HHM8_9GAMM|nr:DNA ligase [Thiomicrorhabdus sediminis]QCU89573.1 DNA ligase [Thiomicrorhabdus sediminis]
MISLVFVLGFFVSGIANSAPQLLLLQQWEGFNRSQDIKGWLVSEKLDGVRAYWDGKNLLSRQGHKINAPEWFIEGLPAFELDGELWIGRNMFAETFSIVSQYVPDKRWQKVGYYIFEVPNQAGCLLERLQVLRDYLHERPLHHVHLIEQKPVANREELEGLLASMSSQGAEGLVIRKADEPYQTGRSNTALKLKLKQDAECEVVGYTSGKGKYINQVGALKCRLLAEQIQRLFPDLTIDTVIKIGSGLTDCLRAQPPVIGSRIQFEYSGLTKNGLPRFPVFKGVDKRL